MPSPSLSTMDSAGNSDYRFAKAVWETAALDYQHLLAFPAIHQDNLQIGVNLFVDEPPNRVP